MTSEIGDIPGLEAARAALPSAFLRQDFAALAALFAADAALMPPRARIIRGHDAISKFWADIGEQVNEIALEPVEIRALGEEAVREIGRMRMSIGGQLPQITLNKYLALWQRAEETWLIGSLIWNRVSLGQGKSPLRRRGESGQVGRRQVPQLYSN